MKNDKAQLIKIMQEHPELPVIFYVSNDELAYDYGSTVMRDFWCYVETVYERDDGLYGDFDDMVDYYRDMLADDERFADLEDPQYDDAVKEWIEENVIHYEAITISVHS